MTEAELAAFKRVLRAFKAFWNHSQGSVEEDAALEELVEAIDSVREAVGD